MKGGLVPPAGPMTVRGLRLNRALPVCCRLWSASAHSMSQSAGVTHNDYDRNWPITLQLGDLQETGSLFVGDWANDIGEICSSTVKNTCSLQCLKSVMEVRCKQTLSSPYTCETDIYCLYCNITETSSCTIYMSKFNIFQTELQYSEFIFWILFSRRIQGLLWFHCCSMFFTEVRL